MSPLPDNLSGDGAEATLRRSLWNYPTLHGSRMDALAHLMTSIGNGYDWDDDGVLRNLFGDEDEPVPFDEGSKLKADPKGIGDEIENRVASEMNELRRLVRSNFETFYADNSIYGTVRNDDPDRKYMRMWTVPDNARPDWAALAAEAREVFGPLLEAAATEADRRAAAVKALSAALAEHGLSLDVPDAQAGDMFRVTITVRAGGIGPDGLHDFSLIDAGSVTHVTLPGNSLLDRQLDRYRAKVAEVQQ